MRYFLSAFLMIAATFPALAQSGPGDPVAGQALAGRVCANCHALPGQQRLTPTDGAPTFAQIAREPAVTATSLQVFLQTPHRAMPDLILTRQEIADVSSYILSLRPR